MALTIRWQSLRLAVYKESVFLRFTAPSSGGAFLFQPTLKRAGKKANDGLMESNEHTSQTYQWHKPGCQNNGNKVAACGCAL